MVCRLLSAVLVGPASLIIVSLLVGCDLVLGEVLRYLRRYVARVVAVFQACLFEIGVPVTTLVVVPEDTVVLRRCLAGVARPVCLLRVATAIVLLDQSDIVHEGY